MDAKITKTIKAFKEFLAEDLLAANEIEAIIQELLEISKEKKQPVTWDLLEEVVLGEIRLTPGEMYEGHDLASLKNAIKGHLRKEKRALMLLPQAPPQKPNNLKDLWATDKIKYNEVFNALKKEQIWFNDLPIIDNENRFLPQLSYRRIQYIKGFLFTLAENQWIKNPTKSISGNELRIIWNTTFNDELVYNDQKNFTGILAKNPDKKPKDEYVKPFQIIFSQLVK